MRTSSSFDSEHKRLVLHPTLTMKPSQSFVEKAPKVTEFFGEKRSLLRRQGTIRDRDHFRVNSVVYSSADTIIVRSHESKLLTVIFTLLSYTLVAMTLPLSLIFCLKVVKEYERAVIFRMGRLLPGGAKGPGLFFIVPCIDTYRKVDLRVVSCDIPPQEILSKDSVTASVDAVMYFRVLNPVVSVTNVNDAFGSTKLLAQTTLRNVLGTKTLGEMLSEREAISHLMQNVLDEATDPWGIKVERVEVKDIRLPDQLMRAMAAEAEATREARANLIAAEGEQKASCALKEAAEEIMKSPTALQLRYLQCLNACGAEHNSTIVFPLAVDIINRLFQHNEATTAGSDESTDMSTINDGSVMRETQ